MSITKPTDEMQEQACNLWIQTCNVFHRESRKKRTTRRLTCRASFSAAGGLLSAKNGLKVVAFRPFLLLCSRDYIAACGAAGCVRFFLRFWFKALFPAGRLGGIAGCRRLVLICVQVLGRSHRDRRTRILHLHRHGDVEGDFGLRDRLHI